MGCEEGLTIPYGVQGTLPEGPRGPDMELVSGSFEHDSSCSLGPDSLSLQWAKGNSQGSLWSSQDTTLGLLPFIVLTSLLP